MLAFDAAVRLSVQVAGQLALETKAVPPMGVVWFTLVKNVTPTFQLQFCTAKLITRLLVPSRRGLDVVGGEFGRAPGARHLCRTRVAADAVVGDRGGPDAVARLHLDQHEHVGPARVGDADGVGGEVAAVGHVAGLTTVGGAAAGRPGRVGAVGGGGLTWRWAPR